MPEEEKKIIKVVRPAGFRDFYPEDYVKVNFILETMKRVAQEFGYVEYVTPAVESLKLYELKSGEGLINETFKVESRTGQKLVLIPELTPSLSRMLAEQQQYYTKPIRWFSIPKCYRDESVQRGRVKEFWQINVDILGMDEIYADAEIIAILVKIITRCGLKKEHFVVRINDRSFMQQFFTLLNITDFIPVIQIFDRKDKILQEKIQKELLKKFSLEEATDIALKLRQAKSLDEKIFKTIPDTPETRNVVNNFNTLRKSAFYDELANLGLSKEKIDILFKLSEIKDTPEKFIQKINTVFEGKKLNEMMKNLIDLSVLLKAFNILDYVEYDGSLARGLDYYTGIVFEAWSRESILPRAIAGGGRYDDLVSTIGGSPLAGTGFGFGETVLLQLMDDFKIKFPKLESSDIYIAPIDLTEFTTPIKIADQLRANGWKVTLNFYNWKIKRHFENAEKQGNIWMIIIGKKDLATNLVTVRNILTGEQETIPIDKLVPELKKKLKK